LFFVILVVMRFREADFAKMGGTGAWSSLIMLSGEKGATGDELGGLNSPRGWRVEEKQGHGEQGGHGLDPGGAKMMRSTYKLFEGNGRKALLESDLRRK
jgi:hypothetical protein